MPCWLFACLLFHFEHSRFTFLASHSSALGYMCLLADAAHPFSMPLDLSQHRGLRWSAGMRLFTLAEVSSLFGNTLASAMDVWASIHIPIAYNAERVDRVLPVY